MAQWGTIVEQRADVIQTGPTSLMNAQRVTVRTIPTGIVFDLLIPQAAFDDRAIEATAGAMAESIESMVGLGGVEGAEYVEDLNAAGQLEFFLDVTVSVPPPNPLTQGQQTAVVRIPLFAFGESILRNRLITAPIEAAKGDLSAWASA